MSSPFCTDLDSESKWRRLPTQFQFHKIVHVEASLVRNALAVNFTRVFRARVQMRTDISPENCNCQIVNLLIAQASSFSSPPPPPSLLCCSCHNNAASNSPPHPFPISYIFIFISFIINIHNINTNITILLQSNFSISLTHHNLPSIRYNTSPYPKMVKRTIHSLTRTISGRS